jgi:outer membrane protein assembly factor BamB
MKRNARLRGLFASPVSAAELPQADAMPDFRKAAPLERTTRLVRDGRAPVILAPEHAEGQAAGTDLARALESRLGIAPAVVTRLEDTRPGEQTCIALGNMLDNELLTRLYFSGYTYEDAQFPGEGGHTVHTVYDPHHWPGGNVIVLGASRPEALQAACERMLGLLQETGADTRLPYTLVIDPPETLSDADRAELMAEPVDPSFAAFRGHAESYLKTGEEAYAQLAVLALDTMVGIYADAPDRKVPWAEETTSGAIFSAWDAFEECPLITDEKRPAYLDAFLRWSRDLTKRSYEYRRIDESFTVTWNHTTFALLGLYHAGRYFHRHHEVTEAAEWLRRSRLGFQAQARSWKPQEDADGYLVHTMRHVIDFSLADWDLAFFEKGLMRQYADYVVSCGDSRQLPAGFGDSGLATAPRMASEALPTAFWWTRDGGYRWILEHLSSEGWQNPYWQDVEATEPEHFTGLNVHALDRQIYDDTQSRPSYNEPLRRSDVPFEEAWDKISFRESWDPDGQYLLLDGIGRGKHLHYDTNGITTFVQEGERWLLDHDYLTRNSTEHTMLSVLRNGRCDTHVPGLAGLAASGDLPGLAATRTYVRDYNGVDWEREVLWCKGAWFLVRDSVTAREPGEYDLDLTWKTMDRGDQEVDDAERFTARHAVEPAGEPPAGEGRKGEGALHIVPAIPPSPAEPLAVWETRHVRQGISVPVSILHQRWSGALAAGEGTVLCSLVYATGPRYPTEYDVQALERGTYAVTSDGGTAVAGFGQGTAGTIRCDAEAWLLDDGILRMVAARAFAGTRTEVRIEPAANLVLDAAKGELTVISAEPTRLSAIGCSVASEVVRSEDGHLDLPAGTNVLEISGFDGAGSFAAPVPSTAVAGPVEASATPAAEPLWTRRLSDGESVGRITAADIDGDGEEELLVACGNAGHAVAADGRLLWSQETEGVVRDVSVARFAGDAPATVLVSSADTHLYQVDPAGVLQRKDVMTGIYFNQDHGERPWGLYCTRALDTDADGVDDMLVTTLASMETQGLEPDGTRRWRTPRTAYHGCMDLVVQDLDGDGGPEIVLGNKYGSICILEPDGTQLASSYTSIGDVAFGVADLDGDGTFEVVHGSSTGDLVAVDLEGKVLWRFDNFGYPVERILSTDLNGDGRPEVLVASGTGYLHCLAPDGSLVWGQRLGAAVHDVVVADGLVVAGTEEGEVHVLDVEGKTAARHALGDAVVRVSLVRSGGQAIAVAGLSDGRLVAVQIETP